MQTISAKVRVIQKRVAILVAFLCVKQATLPATLFSRIVAMVQLVKASDSLQTRFGLDLSCCLFRRLENA